MTRQLFVAALLSLAPLSIAPAEEPPEPKVTEVTFTATVLAVDVLGRFEGKAILVDAIPRFVLRVEIDEDHLNVVRQFVDAIVKARDRHPPGIVMHRAQNARQHVDRILRRPAIHPGMQIA